jgi:hypothetical protein
MSQARFLPGYPVPRCACRCQPPCPPFPFSIRLQPISDCLPCPTGLHEPRYICPISRVPPHFSCVLCHCAVRLSRRTTLARYLCAPPCLPLVRSPSPFRPCLSAPSLLSLAASVSPRPLSRSPACTPRHCVSAFSVALWAKLTPWLCDRESLVFPPLPRRASPSASVSLCLPRSPFGTAADGSCLGNPEALSPLRNTPSAPVCASKALLGRVSLDVACVRSFQQARSSLVLLPDNGTSRQGPVSTTCSASPPCRPCVPAPFPDLSLSPALSNRSRFAPATHLYLGTAPGPCPSSCSPGSIFHDLPASLAPALPRLSVRASVVVPLRMSPRPSGPPAHHIAMAPFHESH